ncbi:MAG: NUDIX domain-containing protein [Candidatus Latescibacterota bacterium]|jgi:phosphatase NudJ
MSTLEDHYSRDPIPTWFFVLVVVRREGKYLLVQESLKDNPWYIPAGRVEAGENLVEAAEREVEEEGGIPVIVDGVIRVDHTPFSEGVSRIRVYMTARPRDNSEPKSQPDENSLRADWFSLDQIKELPLRGEEALLLCQYVDVGAPVYPLEVLGVEDFSA